MIKKVGGDIDKNKLDEAVAGEIEDLSEQIKDQIESEIDSVSEVTEVPLMTQIASPYPPESADWADGLYAGGSADYPGSCGDTISDCGCALVSFAMLGQSYGLMAGVDGSESVPPNIDAWLLANNGYDSKGNILWDQALKYFSEAGMEDSSYFSRDEENENNKSVVDQYLGNSEPVILKTKATNRDGRQFTHFILGKSLSFGIYGVNDPLWYNTEILDDDRNRDSWVQDYNNFYSQGRLFSFNRKPRKVASVISAYLASPAELLLTDSDGNKLGFDPVSSSSYQELPGKYYKEEAVYSQKLADSGLEPHVTKILNSPKPNGDVYKLEVIGTDAGDYTLTVLVIGEDGHDELYEVSSTTSAGLSHGYLVTLPEVDDELLDKLKEALLVADELEGSKADFLKKKLLVIIDKVEKGKLVPAESITESLISQLLQKDNPSLIDLVEILDSLPY